MLQYYLSGILILLCFTVEAQIYERTDQRPGTIIGIHYGRGAPLGDMAARFGDHNALGLSPGYMTSSGWVYGLTARYFWGARVKDNIASNLFTSEGFIIGNNQGPVTFKTRERGGSGLFSLGKIFDLDPGVGRTGIRTELGVGMMWHRVRLQDDTRSATQILDPYHKGYDRLTGGMAGSIDISFQFMEADRGLNFNIGVNYLFASTESWRGYNYDTRSADTDRRYDGMITAYVAFILPIYRSTDSSNIYY
jgi:hypothetical protein